MSRMTWEARASLMRPGDVVRGIRNQSRRGSPEIVLACERIGPDTEVTYMVAGEPGSHTTRIPSTRKVVVSR